MLKKNLFNTLALCSILSTPLYALEVASKTDNNGGTISLNIEGKCDVFSGLDFNSKKSIEHFADVVKKDQKNNIAKPFISADVEDKGESTESVLESIGVLKSIGVKTDLKAELSYKIGTFKAGLQAALDIKPNASKGSKSETFIFFESDKMGKLEALYTKTATDKMMINPMSDFFKSKAGAYRKIEEKDASAPTLIDGIYKDKASKARTLKAAYYTPKLFDMLEVGVSFTPTTHNIKEIRNIEQDMIQTKNIAKEVSNMEEGDPLKKEKDLASFMMYFDLAKHAIAHEVTSVEKLPEIAFTSFAISPKISYSFNEGTSLNITSGFETASISPLGSLIQENDIIQKNNKEEYRANVMSLGATLKMDMVSVSGHYSNLSHTGKSETLKHTYKHFCSLGAKLEPSNIPLSIAIAGSITSMTDKDTVKEMLDHKIPIKSTKNITNFTVGVEYKPIENLSLFVEGDYITSTTFGVKKRKLEKKDAHSEGVISGGISLSI